jgi:HSP20 family protein
MDEMKLLFEPFAPLFELSRELDRYLAPNGTLLRSFMPPADVRVTDNEVTVTMDVPGLTADDVSIELDGNALTVSGERTFPEPAEGDGDRRAWQRLERRAGKFERVLRVPEGLDPDAISATISDGVLTIHIPMPEARKPRRIEIASGTTQPALSETTGTTGTTDSKEPELAATAA